MQNHIKKITPSLKLVVILATATSLSLSNPALSETAPNFVSSKSLLTDPFLQAQEPESGQPQQEPRVLVAEVMVKGVEGELQDLVYEEISTTPGTPHYSLSLARRCQCYLQYWVFC